MITKWVIKSKPEITPTLIDYVKKNIPLDPVAIKVLLNRNFSSPLEIEKFINPKLEYLYDPFLLKGMRDAVCILTEAIASHKKILIHGDYDIDGVTSTALLSRVLTKLHVAHVTYIPDRLTEGYGLNREAVDYAVKENVSLIVTVDCGISAFDEVAYAKELGIQVVITDHHRPSPEGLPAAVAVINPWQVGGEYPCKELTGVGIAFKLAQALTSKVDVDIMDLVALGTVGDVANLIDENRIFVKEGLKAFERRSNVGLNALCQVSGIDNKKIVASTLGFAIGPRINATGRLGSAKKALELLLTEDKAVAEKYALMLDEENKERQNIGREILRQALEKIEQEVELADDYVIVLWDKDWHQGVVGIIASRLVEKFNKPALVISVGADGLCKGSGRSIKGIDLFKLLSSCADQLIAFGGHEYAAGFEIAEDQLVSFRKKMNTLITDEFAREIFNKELEVDLEITFYDINKTLIKNLDLFKPYGRGNQKPLFLTRRLRVMSLPTMLRGGGLKFSLSDGAIMLDAIWFRPNGFTVVGGEEYDLIYALGFDTWFGFEKVMLEVRDMQKTGESCIEHAQ